LFFIDFLIFLIFECLAVQATPWMDVDCQRCQALKNQENQEINEKQ